MPRSLTETLDDPEFRKLSSDAQKIVLGHYGVSDELQGKLLEKIRTSPAATAYDKYLASGAPTKIERPKPSGIKEAFQTLVEEPAKAIGRLSAPNVVGSFLEKKGVPMGLLPSFIRPSGLPSGSEAMTTGLMTMIPEGEAERGGMFEAEARAPKMQKAMPEPPLLPEQQAKYTESLDKANEKFAADSAKYQKGLADAATERKRGFQGEPGGPQFEAEKAANRKAALSRGSETYTKLTHDNLQSVYKAARGSLDQRWGDFRKQMEGAELDAGKAFNMVEEAKNKYLKGSPASLSVFNNLIREMGVQDFVDEQTGQLRAVPPSGALPFDTGRVHYSAIMDKLAGGGLPGNVFQALRAVAQGLDKQLTDAADVRGMGKVYGSLKADEHQFRSDWTDAGSPLAKAYKAKDHNYLAPQLTGKGSDILMRQLSRYQRYGAKPYLPAAARRMATEAEAVKVPKAKPTKGLTVKRPELEPVPRPEPKTKVGGLPWGRRMVGRTIGGAVGGTAAHAVGIPGFIGWHMGADAATDALLRAQARSKFPPPPE
jgi:hypothetical protein